MENKIYGYVYLITNLINGKQYVGQTVRTIKKRFSIHCSAKKPVISRAIRKHGRENFIVQELAVAYNQEELNFLEGLYMSWFNTLAPNGYNIAKIINGKGKHSEESKEKMKTIRNRPKYLKISSENGIKIRGKIVKNSSSKYIGVCITKNKFKSYIGYNSKKINIGFYKKEIDAAMSYDIAAIKYFGNDAILNFPELRQDYIDCKIIINKNNRLDYSKSGEIGITFHKKDNRWRFRWFDKINNKEKSKNFKKLEDAIEYKRLNS